VKPRRSSITITLALLVTTVACTSSDQADTAGDSCRAIIAEAVSAREIPDQIALLDRALIICRSSEAFETALADHPDAFGVSPADFAQTRCDAPPNERVSLSSICRELSPPTTTQPILLDSQVETYLGVTLDGREVILNSAEIRFVEGRPAVIVQITDIAEEAGCGGVEREYRSWVDQVLDPERGDEASVYAQHALNLLRFFGCPPLT